MSVFLLSVVGQVESAAFPGYSELFIKYQFAFGDDWIVTTGIEEGISQVSIRYEEETDFVFNFPLDITFKSTNPRGWPQLVLCVYGRDFWGHEVLRGYGICHVPVSLGSGIRKTVGLFVPDASNVVSRIASWISGRRPELRDPRMLTRNRGREVLRTRSMGCVQLVLNILSKDMQGLGYTVTSSASATTVDLDQLPSNIPTRTLSTPVGARTSNDQIATSNFGAQFSAMSLSDRQDSPSEAAIASRNPRLEIPERRVFYDSNVPQSSSIPPQSLSPRVTVLRRAESQEESKVIPEAVRRRSVVEVESSEIVNDEENGITSVQSVSSDSQTEAFVPRRRVPPRRPDADETDA